MPHPQGLEVLANQFSAVVEHHLTGHLALCLLQVDVTPPLSADFPSSDSWTDVFPWETVGLGFSLCGLTSKPQGPGEQGREWEQTVSYSEFSRFHGCSTTWQGHQVS